MKSLLLIIIALFIFISCAEKKEAMDESANESVKINEPTLTGAWELVNMKYENADSSVTETPHKSIYVFTGKHYSEEIAWKDRPSWVELEEGQNRDEDIINAYDGLVSNSGSYEIIGDSLIRHVIVSKYPNFMNDKPRFAVHITWDEDEIILETSGNDRTVSRRLKRIE